MIKETNMEAVKKGAKTLLDVKIRKRAGSGKEILIDHPFMGTFSSLAGTATGRNSISISLNPPKIWRRQEQLRVRSLMKRRIL